MEKIYFRPNAPLSSLFTDVPNEGICIQEDMIHESITDYHGNILVEKDDFAVGDRPSIDILKTLIMSFDQVSVYIDLVPKDDSWESLCEWFNLVLLNRGWIPMKSGQIDTELTHEVKCVNGQELFFEMEID